MVFALMRSRKWKSFVMFTPIPLLEEGGGHDLENGDVLCLSDPEKWKSVAMATPISLPEGRKGGNHDVCLSLLVKWWSSWGVDQCSLIH